MYQALIAIVQRALAAASPAALQRAAALLSKYIGRPVAASANSVLSAIRTYAANNPQKVMVLTTVLANAGIEIATDEIKTMASHSPIMNRLTAEVVDAMTKFAEERANNTGDKSPSTVHGIPVADVNRQVSILAATNQIIEKASRAVGGLSTLELIRSAIHLEDEDFQNFRALTR